MRSSITACGTGFPACLSTDWKVGPTRPRAIVLVEACVALALIGIVLGMVSLLLTRYSLATDYFLNCRRVQLAAESQMEALRSGVRSVQDADFTDEAGIRYRIRVADPDNAWAPLRHVHVAATATAKHGRQVRFEVKGYVAPGNNPKGERP